jgi:hypothetical protein
MIAVTGKKQNKENSNITTEITFDQFEYKNDVRGYNYHGRLSKGIIKDENSGKYIIRILRIDTKKFKHANFDFDYFELDRTGLIISSPKGMAKKFNGKFKIIDIDCIAYQYLRGEL